MLPLNYWLEIHEHQGGIKHRGYLFAIHESTPYKEFWHPMSHDGKIRIFQSNTHQTIESSHPACRTPKETTFSEYPNISRWSHHCCNHSLLSCS